MRMKQRQIGYPGVQVGHVSRRIAITLAALALSLPAAAGAGSIERLPSSDGAGETPILPGIEEGRWRSRSQLVWDSVVGRLTRRSYRVWDPFPSLDLEFLWHPEDTHADHPGLVNGPGLIEWRLRGAPSYDPSALVAIYRGEVLNGRPNGDGHFHHRSGLTYEGGWRNGLMHGEGRLMLPNGDEYVGGFQDGKRHGLGLYVDSRGNAYNGGFVAGFRDGEGLVTRADAQSYRAHFRAGREVASTRVSLPSITRSLLILVSNYPTYDDARLGVKVDRRPEFFAARGETLHYTGRSQGETLDVFPDHPRFMGIWKGDAEIQLTEHEESGHGLGADVLGTEFRFEPVPLTFELENRSPGTMRILGAFLDVTESQTDAQPFVQLSTGYYDECSGFDGLFNATIHIENYGWAPAESARIEFEFADADGRRRIQGGRRELGIIDRVASVDLTPDLARAGLNVGLTSTKRFDCTSDDDDACVREISASGALGSLADLVWVQNGVYFLVSAKGNLEYDWRDAVGSSHHRTSPFSARLVVATQPIEVECGEGALLTEIRQEPFKLQLDRKDYRIPVGLRDDIPAGVTGRWRIKLDADKSSIHQLRFVVQLADGREVASRPIRLQFARPAMPSVPAPASGQWR